MRLSILTFLLFIFGAGAIEAQNLLPNPSFEDTITRTTPLYLPLDWIAPTNEGFNYFTPLNNSISPTYGYPSNYPGYQLAKTGQAIIGIQIYDHYLQTRSPRREYLQAQLLDSLKKDSIYCFRVYLSFADSMHVASRGQLGVYFSSNSVGSNNIKPLPYTPQVKVNPNRFVNDRINWMEFNQQYQAMGGEQYITIGNFFDTTSLDTQFVAGGGNQIWMNKTFYYLDDVWLGNCDSLPPSVGLGEEEVEVALQLFPNPSNGELKIETKENVAEIAVYSLQGKLLRRF